MNHDSLSFTSIQSRVHVNLFFALLLAALRASCCCGLLRDFPIEWPNSSWRPPSHKNCFQLHYSGNGESLLERAGGVKYRQSVCTPQEMDLIQKEISLVLKHHLTVERSTIAKNRLGCTLKRKQARDTIHILEEGSVYKLVQRLADSSNCSDGNRKVELASEIPVEVRLYEKVGASMPWHQDDVLYDPPQLEIVFTLENNSDCVTMWKMQANTNSNYSFEEHNEEVQSQETHPNSVLLLVAGGPDHCVSSLKRGRRVILKCAYVFEGATYVGEEDCRHYGRGKKGRGNTKRKSKSKKRKRNGKR